LIVSRKIESSRKNQAEKFATCVVCGHLCTCLALIPNPEEKKAQRQEQTPKTLTIMKTKIKKVIKNVQNHEEETKKPIENV
jgi:hypothetical protein